MVQESGEDMGFSGGLPMRSPLYDPRGQMAIADYVKDCRLVRLKNAGHVPLMDTPLQFTRELGRFLKG